MRQLCINFSNALEKLDRTEIGLLLVHSAGSPDLNIGRTLAIFKESGTSPLQKDLLTISARG